MNLKKSKNHQVKRQIGMVVSVQQANKGEKHARKSFRLDSFCYGIGFSRNCTRSSASSYLWSSCSVLGLDIVGSVVGLVKQLGAEGLVGLVAVWVLWGIYSKK